MMTRRATDRFTPLDTNAERIRLIDLALYDISRQQRVSAQTWEQMGDRDRMMFYAYAPQVSA